MPSPFARVGGAVAARAGEVYSRAPFVASSMERDSPERGGRIHVGTVRPDGRHAGWLASLRRRGLGGGARFVRLRPRGGCRAIPRRSTGSASRCGGSGERDAGIEKPARCLRCLPPPRRRPRGGAASPCTWPASIASTAGRRRPRAGSRGRAACSRRVGTVTELGWLRIEEAKRADDPAAAERLAREALRGGARAGEPRHRVHGARAVRAARSCCKDASTRASPCSTRR